MIKYRTLLESIPNVSLVLGLGDFNPPTIGHELLIKKVKKIAEYQNYDYAIYVSSRYDKTNNPLTIDKKLHYLNLMFPNTNFVPNYTENLINLLRSLNNRYKHITLIIADDNISDVNKAIQKSNHSVFYYDSIKVLPLGIDNPDFSDGPQSPIHLRIAAYSGDITKFQAGLPSFFRFIDARRLMNDIRDGMGLTEIRSKIEFPHDKVREDYFNGKIFNVGDVVESAGEWYTIVGKGTNYVHLEDNYGNKSRKWLQECTIIEEAINQIFRSKDRLEVGRIIGYLLGVDNVQSLSAENAVDRGLYTIRSKRLTPEVIDIIKRMLAMATSMNINYNKSAIPALIHETVVVDKDKKNNIAQDILRSGDFELLSRVANDGGNNKNAIDDDDTDVEDKEEKFDATEVGSSFKVNDMARKLRAKYNAIDEGIVAADRSATITGRKTIARVVTFSNSNGGNMLSQTDPSDTSPVVDKDDAQEISGRGLYGPKVTKTKNKPLMAPAKVPGIKK